LPPSSRLKSKPSRKPVEAGSKVFSFIEDFTNQKVSLQNAGHVIYDSQSNRDEAAQLIRSY
jgi:hypothetical protein